MCLAVVLSQPAFLRAASIKSVAMAMATCREARDAVRATIAAMAAETREIEARVHHHGTIKSLQDPEFPAWGPSNGIYVGGRDPTKTRESCEMVALMSVDAAKSNWRVLFTVTLACHNACDPGCFCTDSNSFVIRAFVQHLGVWQWVPVFTIYNVCGTFDAEVIAVASPTVESELCTRLELDKGQLGFVVRALILNSEVHHFQNVSRTPWAYAVVAHAAKKKLLRMNNEDAFERLIERTCWTVDSVVESATDRRDEEAREAAAEERNALIEYDTARCFPRRFGVPEPPPLPSPAAGDVNGHPLPFEPLRQHRRRAARVVGDDENGWHVEVDLDDNEAEDCCSQICMCEIVTYKDKPYSTPTSSTSNAVLGPGGIHSDGGMSSTLDIVYCNTDPCLGDDTPDNHLTSPRCMVVGVERLFINDGPLADPIGNGEPDARIFTTLDLDQLIEGWNQEPPSEFESFEMLRAWRDEIIRTRTVCVWALVSRLEASRGEEEDDEDEAFGGRWDEGVWYPRHPEE